MRLSREQLHNIVDMLPNEKLPTTADLFKLIYVEEEYISTAEQRKITATEKRIANGEYVTLDALLNDQDE